MVIIEARLQLLSHPGLTAVTAVDLHANDFATGGFFADLFGNFQIADKPAKFLVGGPAVAGFDGRPGARVFGRAGLALIMDARHAPIGPGGEREEGEEEKAESHFFPLPIVALG